ncbi:MAG: hypothetical protein Q7T30_00300 [Planctomycetota bacterium]|nr:hypothetical protein [Planctomycetota bacterium]
MPLLVCTAVALGQQPEEPEPPRYEGDPYAQIERESRLIDLRWRRDANGHLEYAIVGAKEPKWKRVLPDDFAEVVAIGGIAGWVVPLLHHGDVLSLTDGDAHLRHVGRAIDTAALVAFARAPFAAPAQRLDELDRLVAVDVLRARGDEAAKAALARLAAEASAPIVRTRAAAAPPLRERLSAADLMLPERSDLIVVIDHGRLVDAHELLGLARFTGLVSTGMVLSRLKRPRLDDAAIGQAESDAMLVLPFELVRRIGAIRFDHTCVAVRWAREIGGEFTWACATAGSFEPARIADGLRGLPIDGFDLTAKDDGATAKWAGGSGALTNRRASAHSSGVDVAAQPALASHLLRDGAYSVRLHVPAGSKVLPAFALGGLPNMTAYDVQVSLGDPTVVEETLTMKSEEDATTTAGRVEPMMRRVLEQSGYAEILAAMGASDVPVKSEVEVKKNLVIRTAWIPAAKYPFVAMARKWILQQARNR